jgi:hypothetical protein
LSDGGQTTVLNLGSVERNTVFGELEALLNERGEFANSAALLAKDFLGVCCADDYSPAVSMVNPESIDFLPGCDSY